MGRDSARKCAQIERRRGGPWWTIPCELTKRMVAGVRNLHIAPIIRFEIPIVEVAQNFACALQGLQ
jgi:hypothetical protein